MDFSFLSIKTALINKLKEYSEWKVEILTIGVYNSIIDLVSFIIEKLAYYVDFLFIETTTNATLKTSIVRLAKDHGYIPKRKSGAIGYILFGSDEFFNSSSLEYNGVGYEIPKWTQFQNSAGTNIVFATESTSLQKGTIQKTIYPTPGNKSLQLAGGQQTGISISNHGLSFGDKVYINGTVNFNGVWILTSYTSSNYIALDKTYVEEDFTGLETIRFGYNIIPVREGVPATYRYVAIGNLNEKIPIFSDSIDENGIEVYLLNANNSVNYQIPIVEDLYFVNQIETYTCEVENFADYTGLFVKFGDNITSKQLQEGDIILIYYSTNTGSLGNIKSSGIISKPLTAITNFLGETEDIYVTNVDQIIGGTDLETITQIKKQYSRSYGNSRQLTKRDAWEAAIEEKAYIYKSKVWTELDLATVSNVSLISSGKQNYHYITAVNSEGDTITPAQQNDITFNVLIPRKSPVDAIFWQPLNKIRIKFSIFAEINNTISFTDMKTRISSKLKADYGVLNLNFAQSIYNSNYVRTIDLLQDIVRHESTAYYAEENIPISTTGNTAAKDFLATKTAYYNSLEEKVLLVENSTQVWIRRKINSVWFPPLKIAQSEGTNVSGTNFFAFSGNIIYNNDSITDNVSRVSYISTTMLENSVPYITVSGTIQTTNQIIKDISPTNITKIKVGMYVKSSTISVSKKVIAVNTTNNTITVDSATTNQTNSFESLKVGWFPDFDESFGIKDPDDSVSKGFILYLIYQTKDGYGKRTGDLRLGNFNQILDYSEDLSEFNFVYSTGVVTSI